MNKASFILAMLVVVIYGNCIKPNTQPTLSGEMTLLNHTENGQKFIIGNISTSNRVFVAKLKGSAYDMGKAYGILFKEELKKQMTQFFSYYRNQIEQKLESKLPKFLAEQISNGTIGLLQSLLDLNYLITKKYTNPRYYEQIKGIADGSGMPAKTLRRLNLITELIKAACTVIGLWGTATAGNHTLHLRSLDWDRSNPMNQFPMIVAYQPSGEGLHPHVNVAWVGFIGSMTGVSDKISIGEKVWMPPKGSVPMTRYGNPWSYVFRDVMYEANDLKSAVEILNKTHRTCAIHIGLGSVEGSFRMIEYAYKSLNVYDDKNYNHYDNDHPKMAGVAYWDKYVQPSGDACVGTLIKSNYGKWDAESLWKVVGLSHTTGDTQLAVFDLVSKKLFVSYSEMGTNKEAYKRSPFEVDLRQLMSQF